MKQITQTLTIMSSLLMTLLLIQCKNPTKEIHEQEALQTPVSETTCIERVIDADARLGRIRNLAPQNSSLSESIDNYVAGIQTIKMNDCPGAFVAAFEDHIDAWQAMRAITDSYPDLRGEMHALFDQLKKEKENEAFAEALSEIWQSWEEVEGAMAQF